jgi:hypothetical protein
LASLQEWNGQFFELLLLDTKRAKGKEMKELSTTERLGSKILRAAEEGKLHDQGADCDCLPSESGCYYCYCATSNVNNKKRICNLFVTLPNKSCRNSTRGIRGRSISLNDGQVRDGYFVYKLSRGY